MNDDEIVYLTWFEFLVLLRVEDFFCAFGSYFRMQAVTFCLCCKVLCDFFPPSL